jgi:hypothetical protein
LFLDYSVKNLEGLSVGLNGLGPLNWIAKKVSNNKLFYKACQTLKNTETAIIFIFKNKAQSLSHSEQTTILNSVK